VRCVARSAVVERLGAVCAALLLATAMASAQAPVLRLADTQVQGVAASDAALFPAGALESLGFRLSGDAAVLTAVLGADTLRFHATSPFFRRGARTYQLAAATRVLDAGLHLPEQLFIQWLPAAFPDRFEYRGGALHVRSAAPVAVAPAPAAAAREPEPRVQQQQPPPARPDAASRASARERVIVLDPGHGGRDPGKVGPNGLREKDVTLLIAQRLGAVLRDRGYEVHLTRTTDTLIALADRPKLANRWKGDRPVALFLSIHANAAVATSARGFETFFLSEARTEDERRVAEMENESVRFEERSGAAAPAGLDQVVNDLRSDFLMRASYDLAATMQDRMAAFHPGPNRGVKRAGFYVLVGSIMPAVLIETAFISNRDEAALLGTQAFQQKLAWGIADAVDEFFRRNEHLWVQ
jgi:N-acetylmuramoyl-L-alanine amidase